MTHAEATLIERARALGICIADDEGDGWYIISHPSYPRISHLAYHVPWGLCIYRCRLAEPWAHPGAAIIAQLDELLRWYVEQPDAHAVAVRDIRRILRDSEVQR